MRRDDVLDALAVARLEAECDRDQRQVADATLALLVLADRRNVTAARPPAENEVALGHDFGSITDLGSRVGAKALRAIEARMDDGGEGLAVKDTISIAKLGIAAATAQENSRLKGNDQKLELLAIFGAASGHVSLPDSQVDDAPDLKVLHAELDEERRLLTALAQG